MLKWLGNALLILGAVLGVAVGLAIASGTHLSGVSWLIAVGLVKLALVASGVMMAGGAVLLRLHRRAEYRRDLEPASPETERLDGASTRERE